jgi:2'-5' RNA ligase superfamily
VGDSNPDQTISHWWPRPDRRPGRELLQWHMLFDDQPEVRQLAATAQDRLLGFDCLDVVDLQWLHLTTFLGPFTDETTPGGIDAMVDEADRLLKQVRPIQVSFGQVRYDAHQVVLPAEPQRALDRVLDSVREATRAAGHEGRTVTDPWSPHVSIAYFNRVAPMAPVVAALGHQLAAIRVLIRSVSLVAQFQVERSWQWRLIAEVSLGSA